MIKEEVGKLELYYDLATEELSNEGKLIKDHGGKNKVKIKDDNKNLILYGPPGTGKTFNVVNKALKIIV